MSNPYSQCPSNCNRRCKWQPLTTNTGKWVCSPASAVCDSCKGTCNWVPSLRSYKCFPSAPCQSKCDGNKCVFQPNAQVTGSGSYKCLPRSLCERTTQCAAVGGKCDWVPSANSWECHSNTTCANNCLWGQCRWQSNSDPSTGTDMPAGACLHIQYRDVLFLTCRQVHVLMP